MDLILLSLICYLLGSLPFSYLIASLYGKNLYQIGSKNIGTANVYRATGRPEATLLALVGDLGKGALAIYLAQHSGFTGPDFFWAQFLAATFVIIGHNWPVFLGFRGGRGLASLAGVLLALNWKAILLALGIILLVIFLTEVVMKKSRPAPGAGKLKKIIAIIISQILGRVLGITLAVIVIYILYPDVFKIAFLATVISGLKHVKRTKDFLSGEKPAI